MYYVISSNALKNLIVLLKGKIPTKISQLTNDAGYTKNIGTITGIKMNGASKGTSGVVDLGTVITEHRGIQNNLTSDSTTESLSAAQGKALKALVDGKANSSDLISHIGDSVKHVTSTERTNWNAAKTHADSAHNYLPLTGGVVTGTIALKPASGEGGQLELDASSANTSQNGIILDQYNGNFRIFGKASADGTSVTGTGTTLYINPYSKTISGDYYFNGTTQYSNILKSAIASNVGTGKVDKYYYIGSYLTTSNEWKSITTRMAFFDGANFSNSGDITISARHDGTNNKWSKAKIYVQSMSSDWKNTFHLIEVSNTELQLWVQIKSSDFWTATLFYIYGNRLTLSSTPSAVYDALPKGTDHIGECAFYGNLAGNASTANKLATARTISLTGSVTGSGSFDGSGNLSIATKTNHSHSDATTTASGFMTSTDKSKLNGIESGAIRIHKALTSNGTTATTTKGYTYGVAGVTSSPYNYAKWYAYLDSGVTTLTNGMIISIRIPVNGCNYGCCISIDGGTTFKPVVYNTGSSITTHYANGVELLLMYDSNGTGTIWSNSSSAASVTGVWRVMNSYDSGNTVSSAMCYTAAGTAAKTATFHNYALLAKSYLTVNIAYSNTAKSALTMNINNRGAKPIRINGAASSSSNYTLPAGTYIAYYDGTNYCFRTDGKIPANVSGNADTATKLATARTISLTGSVTGSGSFDGSGNLSIATKTNHSHTNGTSDTAGFTKLYSSTGTNTDGAMTQKAVTEALNDSNGTYSKGKYYTIATHSMRSIFDVL